MLFCLFSVIWKVSFTDLSIRIVSVLFLFHCGWSECFHPVRACFLSVTWHPLKDPHTMLENNPSKCVRPALHTLLSNSCSFDKIYYYIESCKRLAICVFQLLCFKKSPLREHWINTGNCWTVEPPGECHRLPGSLLWLVCLNRRHCECRYCLFCHKLVRLN